MRVGGPYEVEITYIGYADRTIEDITLQLGETYNINVSLSEDVAELGEVVVTGTRSKFAAEKTGATTNISNSQIMNLPTVSRNISDIARLSPYANGMGFAGGDGRSTNFTLDGANRRSQPEQQLWIVVYPAWWRYAYLYGCSRRGTGGSDSF